MTQTHSQSRRLLVAFVLSLAVHGPATYLSVAMLDRDRADDGEVYGTRVELVTVPPEDDLLSQPDQPLPEVDAAQESDDEDQEADEEAQEAPALPEPNESQPAIDEEARATDAQSVDRDDRRSASQGAIAAPSEALRREQIPEPPPRAQGPTKEEREEDERHQPPEKLPGKAQVVDTLTGGEDFPPKDPELLSDRSQTVERQKLARSSSYGVPIPPGRIAPQINPTPNMSPQPPVKSNPVVPPRPPEPQRERSERQAKTAPAERPRPPEKTPAERPEKTTRPEKAPAERPEKTSPGRRAKAASKSQPAVNAKASRPSPPSAIEPPLLPRLSAVGEQDNREREVEPMPLTGQGLSVVFVPQPQPRPPVKATPPVPPSPPSKVAPRTRPRVKTRPQARRVAPTTEPIEEPREVVERPEDPRPPEKVPPEPPPQPPELNLQPSFSVLSQALGDVWIDHVENVEEGDANLLTTAHWRHAPFFQRVRRQVAQNWHPQVAVARHDPGALTYGHRDRRTIVRVVLNDDGSLERVYVIQGCGADFLDDEAVRAVQRGAPFPNPPQGLVDQRTGHAVFSFEFNLTFSAPPLLRLGR